MTLPVFKRPQVFEDLENYAYYIGLDNPDAAERFLDAAEKSFAFIGRTPFIGPERAFRDKRLQGIRFWRIAGFENFLIFYRVEEDRIDILRVIHGAMDLETELGER
jgi:toxin ParE1/3/4